MDLRVTLLAVLATFSHAKDISYELVLSDENIWSVCPDVPPGTLDVNSLFDLSELSIALQEDGIGISGNMTYVWDIQPLDRIKFVLKLLYFDRGTWTPTIFSTTVNDFCKSMYDSKQPWYKLVTGHVANVEDIRDKCISPGTKHIMEPYVTSPIISMGTLREGLYKFQTTLQAFDADNIERPTRICCDVVGNLIKK